MEILCERPVGMGFKEYREHLKDQKSFIRQRSLPIDGARLRKITLNGIKKQGKKA